MMYAIKDVKKQNYWTGIIRHGLMVFTEEARNTFTSRDKEYVETLIQFYLRQDAFRGHVDDLQVISLA